MDEQRLYDFEVRADVERRRITGRACPYDTWTPVNNYLEALAPSVFTKSIKERGKHIPLLMHHDRVSDPVGKPVDYEHRDDGLYVTWEMAKTDQAQHALDLVRDEQLTNLSVGFRPITNDTDLSGEVPRVRRIEARYAETSLVAVGAYPEAQVLMVRSQGVMDPRHAAARRWLAEHTR